MDAMTPEQWIACSKEPEYVADICGNDPVHTHEFVQEGARIIDALRSQLAALSAGNGSGVVPASCTEFLAMPPIVMHGGIEWENIPAHKAKRGDIWWCPWFEGGGRFLAHGADEVSKSRTSPHWYRRRAHAAAAGVLPELTEEEERKTLADRFPESYTFHDLVKAAYNLARSRIRTIGPDQAPK